MGEESVVVRVGLWDVGCGCMAVGGFDEEGVGVCVCSSLGWGGIVDVGASQIVQLFSCSDAVSV